MLAILEALVCDFFATCHNTSVVAESPSRFLPFVRFAGLSDSVYELGLWVLSPYLMQFRVDLGKTSFRYPFQMCFMHLPAARIRDMYCSLPAPFAPSEPSFKLKIRAIRALLSIKIAATDDRPPIPLEYWMSSPSKGGHASRMDTYRLLSILVHRICHKTASTARARTVGFLIYTG